MLTRFGQAAMLAATLVVAMSGARAENPPAKGGCSGADNRYLIQKDYTGPANMLTAGVCGSCCKDNGCCKTDKCGKTDGKCTDCCKDKKCCTEGACCKAKECCKGACGADCGGCCADKSKHVKKASVVGPIIIMMPVPMTMTPPAMPVCAGCPMGYGAMPMPPPPGLTPPMMPPHTIAMPVPPPCHGYYGACPPYGAPMCVPPMSCPAASPSDTPTSTDVVLSLLGMATDLCCAHTQPPSLPALCVSALSLAADLIGETSAANSTLPSGHYLQHPPQYIPPSPPFPLSRELAGQETAAAADVLPPPTPVEGTYSFSGPAPMVTCSAASPAPAATKVCIVAKADSDQLEMSVGDDTCMSCKKMVVKVGNSSLTVTRFDDRVRVRTEDFKAKADCVRTNRKDHLILEGDAVLHYSKDGQCAKVIAAEHIDLNLTTGAMTIKSAPVERLGVNVR